MSMKKEKEIMARLSEIKKESAELGQLLFELRLKRGDEVRRLYFKEKLKQVDIANRFGITQGSVSRIIKGDSCNRENLHQKCYFRINKG